VSHAGAMGSPRAGGVPDSTRAGQQVDRRKRREM